MYDMTIFTIGLFGYIIIIREPFFPFFSYLFINFLKRTKFTTELLNQTGLMLMIDEAKLTLLYII